MWKSRPQSWDPKSWKPCPENHILKFPKQHRQQFKAKKKKTLSVCLSRSRNWVSAPRRTHRRTDKHHYFRLLVFTNDVAHQSSGPGFPFSKSDCSGRFSFSESDRPGRFRRSIKMRNCPTVRDDSTDPFKRWIVVERTDRQTHCCNYIRDYKR
jgi:hypothetical protein